jgi:predicted 3-demethylubiquinone-9 3-methyltransferase (glyoxalase superfamily)
MGREGSVKLAGFSLAGCEFLCIASQIQYAFTFTPSISLFVECESEAELESALRTLSEGGAVRMPVGKDLAGPAVLCLGLDRYENNRRSPHRLV